MSLQAQNKRLQELSTNYNTGQFKVGSLYGVLGNPKYCPTLGDKLEVDSDRLSSNEEYISYKCYKFRAKLSKNKL